jgi:hypothetical protein
LKLRKEHHLREARQQLLVCAALTCPAEVRSECERHLSAVNAAIPTLIFEAKDAAGNDLSAVTVTMDGKPLADRLEGIPISLDPGAHSFHFETAGHAPVDKSFVLEEAQKGRREKIVFGAAAVSAPPAPGQGGEARPAKEDGVFTPGAERANSSSSEGVMSTLRVLGLVSGGVGVAGIGVGVAFGVMAGSASSNQQSACASSTNCPNRGQALSDRSTFTTDSSVEIAGFVAGGALLAAGVVMFIAGGNKAEPEAAKTGLVVLPAISPGGAGLTLSGGF